MFRYIFIFIIAFFLGMLYYSSLDTNTYGIVIDNRSGQTIERVVINYSNDLCRECQIYASNIQQNTKSYLFFQNPGEATYKMIVSFGNGNQVQSGPIPVNKSGIIRQLVSLDQISSENISSIAAILYQYKY